MDNLCLLRPGVGIVWAVSVARKDQPGKLQGFDCAIELPCPLKPTCPMKEMKNSANNNDNLVPMLIPLNSWSFRRLPEFLIPVSRTCWISAPGIQLISRKLLGYWTRHGRSRKRWLQLRRAGGNLGSDATTFVATRLPEHGGKTWSSWERTGENEM